MTQEHSSNRKEEETIGESGRTRACKTHLKVQKEFMKDKSEEHHGL